MTLGKRRWAYSLFCGLGLSIRIYIRVSGAFFSRAGKEVVQVDLRKESYMVKIFKITFTGA